MVTEARKKKIVKDGIIVHLHDDLEAAEYYIPQGLKMARGLETIYGPEDFGVIRSTKPDGTTINAKQIAGIKQVAIVSPSIGKGEVYGRRVSKKQFLAYKPVVVFDLVDDATGTILEPEDTELTGFLICSDMAFHGSTYIDVDPNSGAVPRAERSAPDLPEPADIFEESIEELLLRSVLVGGANPGEYVHESHAYPMPPGPQMSITTPPYVYLLSLGQTVTQVNTTTLTRDISVDFEGEVFFSSHYKKVEKETAINTLVWLLHIDGFLIGQAWLRCDDETDTRCVLGGSWSDGGSPADPDASIDNYRFQTTQFAAVEVEGEDVVEAAGAAVPMDTVMAMELKQRPFMYYFVKRFEGVDGQADRYRTILRTDKGDEHVIYDGEGGGEFLHLAIYLFGASPIYLYTYWEYSVQAGFEGRQGGHITYGSIYSGVHSTRTFPIPSNSSEPFHSIDDQANEGGLAFGRTRVSMLTTEMSEYINRDLFDEE